jgi:hypothetical protein
MWHSNTAFHIVNDAHFKIILPFHENLKDYCLKKKHKNIVKCPKYWHFIAVENLAKVTSLDWKSQCLENPSVLLLWLADKKSRIYRV